MKRTTWWTWLIVLVSMWCAAAQGGDPILISAHGLGGATLGMTPDMIERLLGTKLTVVTHGLAGAALTKVECARVHVSGHPGVELAFEWGHLVAAHVEDPGIATTDGIRVGAPESAVIGKWKRDPSYQRYPDRYDEKKTHITAGKSRFVERAGGGAWQGQVMKVTSKGGVIQSIEGGEARYVLLDEREGC